jgi:hypothetical protein
MVIGLDLNLGAFNVEDPDLRLLQQTVDLFHLPSPAVKMTENERAQWLGVHWN